MVIERFSFKEFAEGMPASAPRPAKRFAAAGKAKEEAPPPPPSFTAEDVKTAERTGYQKGFLEGEKEGRKQVESEQASVDKKLGETVEKFAASLQPLFNDYRTHALSVQQQLPQIALAIARKVAAQALAENAQPVIDDMATHCYEMMMKEPKLSITVHETLADTLAKKLEQLAARLQSATDIVILRDPAIPMADCRIEWSQGGMERKTADIWQEVEKAVADMAVTGMRNKSEQMEVIQTDLTKPL